MNRIGFLPKKRGGREGKREEIELHHHCIESFTTFNYAKRIRIQRGRSRKG